MKIEIEKNDLYCRIPDGYEIVGIRKPKWDEQFLSIDGSVITCCSDFDPMRIIVRRNLYAPIPEGYVEDGWIEANTPEPKGTPYLHPSEGVGYASGSNTISNQPRLRLKKKTRTATVLTARVVLPDGYSGVEPSGDSVRIWGGTRFPFTWIETTEEVPA